MYQKQINDYLDRNGLISINPRAALVDMDGTLYDSMPRHADAWMQLIKENNLRATRNEFFSWEGRTGASVINLLFRRTFNRQATTRECEDLYKRKTELFASMPPVNVMPGAQKLMETLNTMGLRTVLVTGSGQGTLIDRLETDYPRIFPADMRITSRNVTHGKPHPEPFLRAMELAGARPQESIVIENAPLGVQAGVASGAFTIAVNTGPIPLSELEEAGAHLVFPSMQHCAEAMPLLLFEMINGSNI